MAQAAPTPHRNCSISGLTTTCESLCNADITKPRPGGDFYPYGTMPFLVGGH
jgi:hypothetical protein